MFSLALSLLLSASDSQLDQFSSAFNRTSTAVFSEHLMCTKLSVSLHNAVSSTLEFSKFVSHILLQDIQHTIPHTTMQSLPIYHQDIISFNEVKEAIMLSSNYAVIHEDASLAL